MPINGWRLVTLSDVVSLQRGHDLPEPKRIAGNVPVMGSFGLTGWHNTAKCKGPGVTIGRSGASFGVVGYTDKPYWPLNTALYVTDFRDNDERYVYYLLKTIDFTAYNTGSAQPSLNRNHLVNIPINLPHPAEQRAIAAVLGALDNKIEQNRRTGQALEELTRATFKAWFVDFEPVKAKAAGQRSFPGMPHAAFAALTDRLTDSPLGQVPEGWKVGKLGDYCEINKQTVRTGQVDGEIEYIDIASVTVGRLDGVQRVPFADAPSRARRRVRHGDTIWSCVRPNRRSYLFVHSPPENRIVSTGFAVLSPAIFDASYLHELTTRQEFVDYLVANADGRAYPAVRPEHFATADVLVPAAVIREAFEEVTMPLRDLLAANEAESAKLAVLRDYLLPRLLSGQVRVSNSGRFARAAL